VCFFDDTPMNVEAARRLGARAFRVEGVGQLVATLRAQGFLSA
jgi:FMN phosphatase YigB (HAD superfamily)